MSAKDVSLGIGLYAHAEGFEICLRTPPKKGDHKFSSEADLISEFLQFLEHSRGFRIRVEKIETMKSPEDAL